MATADPTPTTTIAFLITGASRGLGKAIAIVASRYFSSSPSPSNAITTTKLHFVLTARSAEDLEQTKRDIEMAWSSSSSSSSNQINVICHAMDLSILEELDGHMDVLLRDLFTINSDTDGKIDRVIFINNHGSLGHLGPCLDSPSLQDMRQSMDLNVTSCLWMSVRLIRHVVTTMDDRDEEEECPYRHVMIVNISSLIAVADTFPTMAIYGAGKAARDKYHAILAKELNNKKGSPHGSKCQIKTLNYAPGPLETDMTAAIRSAPTLDKDLRSNFDHQLLKAEDSAMKLMILLDAADFENGAHIDYYDLPNPTGQDNR